MSSKDFQEKNGLDQSEKKGGDEKGKDVWSQHFHWYHSWDERPKDYDAGCKAVYDVSKDGSNTDQESVSAIELFQKWQAVRYQKRLRKSQTTKALEELLHKTDDTDVPLFHPPSHADGANEPNQQTRETFSSHVSQLAWVYRDLSDPPTHCPNTELSQMESELNAVMQSIPLCDAHEPRLTAISCANSSGDLVPPKKFDEDTGDDEWLEHTNLDLLYEKRPMQHPSEENDGNHRVRMKPLGIYEAKHPSLAPLIAVLRSKQETGQSDSTYPSAGPEIVSVFDVTPERYTSLHILLRRSGFLTAPLLPGSSTGWFANDDEGDDICRCHKIRKNTRLSPSSSSSTRKLYRVGSSPRAHIVDIRARFILLQLFRVTQYLHSHGIALGQALRPDRIFVQNDGWIRLAIPISQRRPKSDQAPTGNSTDTVTATVPTDLHSENSDTVQILPYPGYGVPPTLQWQNRSISNFEYILCLNKAAGRSLGDPHHPPIFPWVTDFTQEILDPDYVPVYSISNPGNGWRDLSRSKFRLQKGDEQLDHTFRHATPPHHIPESISDLTYTVYRARCTPVSTLCSVVRETFVPEHYPDGVMKIYQWTPDEATAEFYMAPLAGGIFESKHKNKGMNDLQLPPWCDGSVHEFIKYHRRILESDFVSHWLHLWIDLNFGEALSGEKAVQAKNVVLSCNSWESEELFCHSESFETCDGGCQPTLLISKKTSQPAEYRGTTNIHQETLIHSTKDSTTLLGDSSVDGSPRHHRTGFIQLFCKPHPSRGDTTNKLLSQQEITSNLSSKESDDLCQHSPIIYNGEDVAPPLTLLDRDYELCELSFEALQKIDLYSLGMIATQLYHSGRTIPSPSVQSMIEELLDGSANLPDYLSHGRDTEDIPSNSFPTFCLEDTYDTLARIQNLSIDVQATDHHRSSALDKVQSCFDQWTAIPNIQRIAFNCELGLLLPVVAESLSNVSSFEENERLNAESGSCASRKLCDFLFIIGNNLGNDGTSAFLLPKVIALFVTAVEIDNEDSLKFIQRMLLSRLIPTLYKISTGSAFFRELVPLLIKLLCVRPQTLKIHSKDSGKTFGHQNSVKKAVAVCLTILSQDDACGRALCCRYIVPQLVSKLGDLRIYDISHYTDQIFHEASVSLPKNPVASALVGVMLFLPEESIGMLICQPILSTFLESMLAGQLSKNNTTLSDKVGHILASAELIAVLRSCVPNLDPETAERYFFSKSSSSLKHLLQASLIVAASKTKLTRCEDFRSSEHRTGKCEICKLASQSTNPSFNLKQDPAKEFCHVSIFLTAVKRALLSEMGGLMCSLARMIKTERFPSTLYPIIENYFSNIVRIHRRALRRNVKDMVNGVSSADESFTRVLRLPGISVAKTFFTLCGPDAEVFCPSIGKLSLWLNHSDSMNARLSIREALANRDVLSATVEGPIFKADGWLSDTEFPSNPHIDSTVTTASEYSLLKEDTSDDYSGNIPGISSLASEQGTRLSRTEDITSTMEELQAMSYLQSSQGEPLSSRSVDVGTDPGWYGNSSFDTDSSNDSYDGTTPESPQLANESRENNFPAWDHSHRESLEKRREDWAWTLGLRPQWTDPWLRIGSYWSSRLVMISSLQANGAPRKKLRSKRQADMTRSDCIGIQSLAVNSSESIVASGNRRGEVCLWDLRQHPPKITTRLVNELKGRAHQLENTQTAGMFGPISQIQFSAPISQLEFLERERTGIACDGFLNFWDVEKGCIVSSINSGVLQTDRNEIGQFLDSWMGLSHKDDFLGFSPVRSGNCMGSGSSCSQEILAITQSNLFRIDMRCGQRSVQSPLLSSVTEATIPNSMWLSRSWMLNSPGISPRGLDGDSTPSSNTRSPADYPSFHFSCVSPADFCDWVCVGSLSGHVHCFERRAGRLLHCWKAHEKAIIAIKSISNHQVLTISRDRTATLWDLRGDAPVKLQRFRDLPGGGSGLSTQNVAVQNFVHRGIKTQGSPIGNSSDNPLSMLYTVSGNKSVSVPIPDMTTTQKSVKLKPKSLRHASGAKKKSLRKIDIRSIALLPLRQLVLLGDDDGTIHVCV